MHGSSHRQQSGSALSDFTYVATWQGFVYVAFITDAYARHIVGWRVSRTAHAAVVLDALEQALADRHPVQGSGLAHRSDRDVQYVGVRYTERFADARPWPRRSLEVVQFATLECIEWFNNRQTKSVEVAVM